MTSKVIEIQFKGDVSTIRISPCGARLEPPILRVLHPRLPSRSTILPMMSCFIVDPP